MSKIDLNDTTCKVQVDMCLKLRADFCKRCTRSMRIKSILRDCDFEINDYNIAILSEYLSSNKWVCGAKGSWMPPLLEEVPESKIESKRIDSEITELISSIKSLTEESNISKIGIESLEKRFSDFEKMFNEKLNEAQPKVTESLSFDDDNTQDLFNFKKQAIRIKDQVKSSCPEESGKRKREIESPLNREKRRIIF